MYPCLYSQPRPGEPGTPGDPVAPVLPGAPGIGIVRVLLCDARRNY